MTRRERTSLLAMVIGIVVLACARPSHAQPAPPPPKAVFAVIVGSNTSVDAELPPLKYADDDAARYVDLFRLLGARTYLLTRVDANTARLHAQAAAEALLPRRAELEKTLAQAAVDVAQARARGVETLFYFIYAGHGSVRNGQGYITLEDARLTGADIAKQVVLRSTPIRRTSSSTRATRTCLRIRVARAACAGPWRASRRRKASPTTSASVSFSRAPRAARATSGKASRPASSATRCAPASTARPTPTATVRSATARWRRSWRARTWRSRTSASARRSTARPPKGGNALLDLRQRTGRRIELGGEKSGHYIVEDARGVRIAETNVGAGSKAQIVRGAPNGTEYVRRVDDDKEFVIPADRPVVSIDELTAEDPRVASRGAAHEAFNLVFTLPFSIDDVAAYQEPAPVWIGPQSDADSGTSAKSGLPARKIAGWSALGVGAVGLGLGVTFSVRAANENAASTPQDSQRGAAARNERIKDNNLAAALSYVGGGAFAVTGLVLLLWPDAPRVTASPTASGFEFGYATHF